MEIIEKYINNKDIEELLPDLCGNVFHVTLWSTLPQIILDRIVRCNNEDRESPFGNNNNGFFRLHDCVSLFDYRYCGTTQWHEHVSKCLPTIPLNQNRSIAILLLKPSCYTKLVTWDKWEQEQCFRQRIVPHIEVGYPGEVSIDKFSKCLHVSLKNSSTIMNDNSFVNEIDIPIRLHKKIDKW